MRITILSGSVPTTTFIDALMNCMAEEGHQVTAIGKQTKEFKYVLGVDVLIVPKGLLERIRFIIRLLFSTKLSVVKQIWRHSKGVKMFYYDLLFYLPIIYSKPDCIHFQWAAFIHNRDLLFDLYPGKILVSMRGAHINYTPVTTPDIKESYKRLFPKVHRFHAVSDAIAEEAVQYGSGIDKTDVIYSFVKEEILDMPIQQRPVRDKLHIISVGRFFWKKGYEYALDALSVLKEKKIPFIYTLIAEGETPASIIYQIHQLGLTDMVQIINGTTHDGVVKAIEEHDVLLLSSVEEGIANVVMEAMSVGTPVITTDVGGMKETVDDGNAGFVVRVRDVQAIANALIEFNNLDADARFDIAKRAKYRIQQRHDKKTFVGKFLKFYAN